MTDLSNSRKVTTEKCIEACKGYKYAGTQYAYTCFCGNTKPSVDKLRPMSECNMKCAGDSTQMCGGSWRMNVYETNSYPPIEEDGACYVDSSDRILPAYMTDLSNSRKVTTEKCIEACKGYKYAGTQYAYTCFCGNTKPSADKLRPMSQCNMKCAGDSSQMCGGSWRMNVYETPESLPSIAFEEDLVGQGQCYKDTQNRILPTHLTAVSNSRDLTTEKCVEACNSLNYLYAGTQYNYECFCGNTKPSDSDIKPATECNRPCAGNQNQMCGGYWRMNVYNTPLALAPVPLNDPRVTYKRLPDNVSYEKAKNWCSSIGGFLPIPQSQAENDLVAQIGTTWLGFETTDMSSVTFTNWNAGTNEPSGDGSEVQLISGVKWGHTWDGRWNDGNGNHPATCFIRNTNL